MARRLNVMRHQKLEKLRAENAFDVAIIGGGINGACLYDTLCRQGYRVLLLDKGDFASGTSQASGMMVWGGFLYLRNFDLASVIKLSSDRNRMVRNMKAWISPRKMRYLPAVGPGRSKWLVHLGLWVYWLMGFCRTTAPASEPTYQEMELIKPGVVRGSLTYEEAFLDSSDARFVFRWIAPHNGPGQLALNYCKVRGKYDNSSRCWSLELEDLLGGKLHSVTAGMIVNCAGVWTDQVNAEFGISTPFRHLLSKGVYLGIRKNRRLQSSLAFELGEHQDVITLVPWGPLSLWGPTETVVKDLSEGFTAFFKGYRLSATALQPAFPSAA